MSFHHNLLATRQTHACQYITNHDYGIDRGQLRHVQCGSKKRQGLGRRVVEILGGGTLVRRCLLLTEHALTQVPRDGDRRTTTRAISALALSEVLCWLLEGGTGDGGYSQSGKGRDNKKLFILLSRYRRIEFLK
jgi:hypothetical protein